MALIRLLQRNPDGSITFHESISRDDVPAYAILSHTWGEEEVTFKDMDTTGRLTTLSNKAGWSKIQFCADQAAKDGLQYFWVDTCCIDQKNAVELSAAINSMFRWYQDAARCYVYMVDVEKAAGDWMKQFMASRWFTRGWTIQELLAPLNVRFFSRDSHALGTKVSLEQQIHDITQIPIRALRRSRLSEFSVDERMKWAAHRQTRIEEDLVYCLFGIFEVFLPPIYGEGKAHALSRLQEVIRKENKHHADGDGSVSGAPPPPRSSPNPKSDLPYGRTTCWNTLDPFIRIPSRQMEKLIEALHQTQHEQIAEIIFANCRQAAYQYALDRRDAILAHFSTSTQQKWLQELLATPNPKGPSKADDLPLRQWIRFLYEFHSGVPKEHESARAVLFAPEKWSHTWTMDVTLGILKLQDPWKRLRPIEFEPRLCDAITWCENLYAEDCQGRLEWLWTALHPSVVDEKWVANLDLSRAEIPSPSPPEIKAKVIHASEKVPEEGDIHFQAGEWITNIKFSDYKGVLQGTNSLGETGKFPEYCVDLPPSQLAALREMHFRPDRPVEKLDTPRHSSADSPDTHMSDDEWLEARRIVHGSPSSQKMDQSFGVGDEDRSQGHY